MGKTSTRKEERSQEWHETEFHDNSSGREICDLPFHFY